MNKDMINIDDFVREKLGGREEKEDPAAWLRMKELLDKEMPERAIPVGFRFGKPLAFLGCALLATIISVGGYRLLHEERSGKDNTNTVTIPANRLPDTDLNTNTNTSSQKNTAAAATGHQQAAVNATVAGGTAHGIAAPAIQPNNDEATTSATANQPGSTSGTPARQAVAPGQRVTAARVNNNTRSGSKTTVTGNTTAQHNTVAAKQRHAATGTHTGSSNNSPNAATAGKHVTATGTAAAATSAGDTRKKQQSVSAVSAATTAHGSNGAAAQQEQQSAGGNTTNGITAGTIQPASGTATTNTTGKAPDVAGNTATAANPVAAGKEANGKTPVTGSAADNTAVSATASGSNGITRSKDSINAIKVINRTELSKTPSRKPVFSSDTVNIGKVEVPALPATTGGQQSEPATATAVAAGKTKKSTLRKIAAANKKAAKQADSNDPKQDPKVLAANNPGAVTPAAGTPTPVPNSAAAQSTAAEKKKKKSSPFAFINNIHWDEVKDNVKYDIGHAQFHMGVAAGANYSVSNNNSFTGFQFGATGELVFNKHLSLMGELKYFNRSGARKMVDDSYVKETARPDSMNASGNYFTVFTDSSHRYFNFSTIHSFEMPVTLRYAIRKFYLMTGINLAYYLGVNVEEIGTKYSQPNRSIVINAAQPILRDTRELDIADFGSRFAIGYVFGAGYQISPAVQADLRLVNTFWDNASTNGAKNLSKDFYKIPSIQLTIGYKFIRSDRARPGYGPTSQP